MVSGALQSPSEPVLLVASAEFTLKSSPVRRTLESRLIDDLKITLSKAGFENFTIEKHAARIAIRGLHDTQSAARCCARVFGVAYAVPALLVLPSMDALLGEIVRLAQRSLRPGQSFAVRCHRIMPSTLQRREIEIKGGSEILQTLRDREVNVDLSKPDVIISVDLVGDSVYVYGDKIQGPGGLPLSSHWKMLAVLDSGPLTLLASYTMMRRGCLVELFIPFSQTISSFSKERQLGLAGRLRVLVSRSAYRTFAIDVKEISDSSGSALRADVRRQVRDAAIRFASKKRYRGVVFSDVTGSLQLDRYASARLEEGKTQPPVFYPLVGFGSEDLFELCRCVGISKHELLSQIKLEQEIHASKEEAILKDVPSNLTVQEMVL
jgi:thiamine biosynthesis protein ThiI